MKLLMSAKKRSKSSSFSLLTGAVSGTINGLFGGGGGMIVVPMLEKFNGYKKKSAHATAILVILPMSILSGFIYGTMGNFRPDIVFPVLIGSVFGGLFGAIILSRFSSKTVAVIFSFIMLFAGIRTAFF